jgi:hypothetical protein
MALVASAHKGTKTRVSGKMDNGKFHALTSAKKELVPAWMFSFNFFACRAGNKT